MKVKPKKTYREGFVVTPKGRKLETFKIRYTAGDFTFKPLEVEDFRTITPKGLP